MPGENVFGSLQPFETDHLCGPVMRLRHELAAAEAAEHLEGNLVAGREQLAALPVAGLTADPQANALARLTGLDEATVRTGLALLLAMLIEAGSALGFALLGLANLTCPAPPHAVAKSARAPPKRRCAGPPQPTTCDGSIERWGLTRLDVDPSQEIPARAAYDDFLPLGTHPTHRALVRNSLRHGVHVPGWRSGGRKVKRRDRAYYVGVALKEAQTAALVKVAA